jgi:hypothetical protein
MPQTVKDKIEDLIYNYDTRPKRIHIKLEKLKLKNKIEIERMPTLVQRQDYINNRRRKICDENNLDDFKEYSENSPHRPLTVPLPSPTVPDRPQPSPTVPNRPQPSPHRPPTVPDRPQPSPSPSPSPTVPNRPQPSPTVPNRPQPSPTVPNRPLPSPTVFYRF